MKTEVKRFPFNMETASVTLGLGLPMHINGWNCIAGVVGGTGNGNRIGKKIFIRYFHIKYTVFITASLNYYEPIRIVCVGDKKASPQGSPANTTSPFIQNYARTPIDY